MLPDLTKAVVAVGSPPTVTSVEATAEPGQTSGQ